LVVNYDFKGDIKMAFIQKLGQLRSPVQTYAQLPITGNVLGDLRILSDLGTLWVWMSSNSSGSLTDWKKVTVSSYNDLVNRPSSSVLDINDATQSYVRLSLNNIWLTYIYIVNVLATIYKMAGGVIDKFSNQTGIDVENCVNQIYLSRRIVSGKPDTSDATAWYAPLKNDLDIYTTMLIHGREVNDTGEFRDLVRRHYTSYNVVKSLSTTKFGNGSMYFSGVDSYIDVDKEQGSLPYPLPIITAVPMTYDFWIYFLDSGEQTIFQDTDSFIKKDADDKILFSLAVRNEPNADLVITNLLSETSMNNGEWYHIVAQKTTDGYLQIYVNGVLDSVSDVPDLRPVTYNLDIKIGEVFHGYIEEFRYSYNCARYTSNFTPLTREYNSSSTEKVMQIISQGFEANAVPNSIRIVILEEDYDIIDPNTDLIVSVSRDGGTTFSQVTLERISDMPDVLFTSWWMDSLPMDVKINIFTGAVDVSSQPNGKELVYKITSHNNKDLRIRSSAIEYK
jgi:hypothetical protein